MSAADDMSARRREFDRATSERDAAQSAVSRHQQHLQQLRQQFERRRAAAVEERVEEAAARAAGGGSGLNPVGLHYVSSVGDLDEMKMEITAAEVLSTRLKTAAAAAATACDRAEGAWKKAVCRFAQAKEEAALQALQSALSAVARASAKAIAAAKVSMDFGEVRGSHNLDSEFWYGSAGQVVAELRRVNWPTWPTAIDPAPFRTGQNYMLHQFAGVAEAETDLLAAVGGESS